MRGGVLPWCPRWRPGLQRFQISGLFSRRELAVHGCPCHTTWVFRHGTRLDRSRRTSHARAHNNASACSSHLPSCLFREGQAAPRASRATCPVTPVLGPESRMVPVPVVPHYGCGRADTAPWPAHWPTLHRPALFCLSDSCRPFKIQFEPHLSHYLTQIAPARLSITGVRTFCDASSLHVIHARCLFMFLVTPVTGPPSPSTSAVSYG